MPSLEKLRHFWKKEKQPAEIILVHFNGSEESKHALKLACELYPEARINLVYVVTVPRKDRLDKEMKMEEAMGDQMLTLGQNLAREWGVEILGLKTTHLLQAWSVEDAIMDDAYETHAAKVILGAQVSQNFRWEESGGLDPVSSTAIGDARIPEVILVRPPSDNLPKYVPSKKLRLDRTRFKREPEQIPKPIRIDRSKIPPKD